MLLFLRQDAFACSSVLLFFPVSKPPQEGSLKVYRELFSCRSDRTAGARLRHVIELNEPGKLGSLVMIRFAWHTTGFVRPFGHAGMKMMSDGQIVLPFTNSAVRNVHFARHWSRPAACYVLTGVFLPMDAIRCRCSDEGGLLLMPSTCILCKLLHTEKIPIGTIYYVGTDCTVYVLLYISVDIWTDSTYTGTHVHTYRFKDAEANEVDNAIR